MGQCIDTREAPPINLLRGWPHTSLLPVEWVKQAAEAALSDLTVAHDALLYGPDPGYEPCRKAIAEWLDSFYRPSPNTPVTANRICITGGASQNLGCMLNVYTDAGYTRNVWIIAPAYMLVFRLFEDAGLGSKMRAIPEDEAGLDIDVLRREIEKSEAKAREEGNDAPRFKPGRKVYKHVIYCVPAFNNPTSRTMSLQRRKQLVELAREYDALITPDDVYDFLQWPATTRLSSEFTSDALQQAHLPRLVDIDRDMDGGPDRPGADGYGNACSNGTFSKIAGPGLRCGWVEGSEKFVYGVSQTGTSRSGGAPSQLTSTYITQLLTTGKIQHLIKTVLQPAYSVRYRTISDAIYSHLVPLGFILPQPDREIVGGYFVWVTLPEGLTARELADTCREEENLIIAPGGIFQVPGDDSVKVEDSIRLCFAWEDVAKLEEAIKRIRVVTEKILGYGDDLDKVSPVQKRQTSTFTYEK